MNQLLLPYTEIKEQCFIEHKMLTMESLDLQMSINHCKTSFIKQNQIQKANLLNFSFEDLYQNLYDAQSITELNTQIDGIMQIIAYLNQVGCKISQKQLRVINFYRNKLEHIIEID